MDLQGTHWRLLYSTGRGPSAGELGPLSGAVTQVHAVLPSPAADCSHCHSAGGGHHLVDATAEVAIRPADSRCSLHGMSDQLRQSLCGLLCDQLQSCAPCQHKHHPCHLL